MTDKTEFIEALDGTEAKMKKAFLAGYAAGLSDMDEDSENEYKWWKNITREQEVKK